MLICERAKSSSQASNVMFFSDNKSGMIKQTYCSFVPHTDLEYIYTPSVFLAAIDSMLTSHVHQKPMGAPPTWHLSLWSMWLAKAINILDNKA